MSCYFLNLHRGDKDAAFTHLAERHGYLIATANLSAIGEDDFSMLCQLLNGLLTDQAVDAKHLLLGTLRDAVGEQDAFRADVENRRFPVDPPESRAAFRKDLDGERERLVKLIHLVEGLDDQACLALLTRIEEVYACEDDEIRTRCAEVFRKKQGRDRL